MPFDEFGGRITTSPSNGSHLSCSLSGSPVMVSLGKTSVGTGNLTVAQIPLTLSLPAGAALSALDPAVVVEINGLINDDNAALELSTSASGIVFNNDTRTLSYDGIASFPDTVATLEFSPDAGDNYYVEITTLDVTVFDGQMDYDGSGTDRRIPVTRENIVRFNDYATKVNTRDIGLARHYRLTENVTLEVTGGSSWTAIGDQSRRFTGSFDGSGFKISKLTINNTADYQGMFGYITGSVRNLGLDGGSIRGRNYVGGIAGYSYGGTVQNCYTTGNITGNDQVGGIVGYNDSAVVRSCYTTGIITGTASSGSSGIPSADPNVAAKGSTVGGIAGTNQKTGSVAATVESCYSTGSVIGNDTGNSGGIVGHNYRSNVQNCYAKASVMRGYYIGGIVGYHGGGTGDSGSINGNVALNAGAPGISTGNLKPDYISRVLGFAAVYSFSSSWQNYSSEDIIVNYNGYKKPLDTLPQSARSLLCEGNYIKSSSYSSDTWWKALWVFGDVWSWDGAVKLPALQNMPNQ